jgi:hypothetical protein
MRRYFTILLLLMFAASLHAMSRTALKKSSKTRKVSTRPRSARARHHRLRFIGFPIDPALRGSRESLLKQNEEIDRLGIPRIENDEQLDALKDSGGLVLIKDSNFVSATSIPADRRYARPWTNEFINDLGQDFYAEFHKPIQVTSAVRTVEQQRKLRRHNGNAAPEFGETASSHLAGTTVDIAKRGLSKKEHKWVVDYLAKLKDAEVIEPEEERRQACFHIMVSDRYSLGKSVKQIPLDVPVTADAGPNPPQN